jgi:hypothetical protein
MRLFQHTLRSLDEAASALTGTRSFSERCECPLATAASSRLQVSAESGAFAEKTRAASPGGRGDGKRGADARLLKSAFSVFAPYFRSLGTAPGLISGRFGVDLHWHLTPESAS